MTINRIRYGNDLLLLKTKKEGITICGENYLSKITINAIEDISFDEIYSYFFSSAFLLLKHFHIKNNFNKNFILNTAKAILYCAEVELMMNGIIVINRDSLIKEVARHGFTKNLDLIIASKKTLEEECLLLINPNDFWFLAREYLLTVYFKLNNKYLNIKLNVSIDSQLEILKGLKFSYFKNIQFLILFTMSGIGSVFGIFLNMNIEKCFWYCLLCLVMAIRRDLSINDFYLNKSYFVLNEMKLVSEMQDMDNYSAWRFMKNFVIECWPMACAKKII